MFLDTIDALIDWKKIEEVLSKRYWKVASANGKLAYQAALPMFKPLLLQRWHGLSDPGLEEAVNDRISFIRFSGFSVSSTLLDHSTICNPLLELNLFEGLFEEINGQLEEQGILVKESNAAIVNATIIESSQRPRKVIEVMAEDRKEDTDGISSPVIIYSDDPDATWLKKERSSITDTRLMSVLIQETVLSWTDTLLLPTQPTRPNWNNSFLNRTLLPIRW